MRELLPKVLKWMLSVFFLILGVSFLYRVHENGHPGPLILAVFSFGLVYWQYKSVKDIPKQVAIATALVMVAGGIAGYYVPLNEFPFNFGFFIDWAACSLIAGTPVIAWAYNKYD